MLLLLLSMLDTPEEKRRFEEIYHTYYKLMLSTGLGILQDGPLAEDAVQQAFLRLIPKFARLEHFSCNQTRNYLVIIVRHVAIDMAHDRSKLIEVPLDEGLQIQNEADDVGRQMEYDEVLDAIETLPDIYKETLYMSYRLGLSVNEIADIIHLSASAVKLRLMRAREKLREMLKER